MEHFKATTTDLSAELENIKQQTIGKDEELVLINQKHLTTVEEVREVTKHQYENEIKSIIQMIENILSSESMEEVVSIQEYENKEEIVKILSKINNYKKIHEIVLEEKISLSSKVEHYKDRCEKLESDASEGQVQSKNERYLKLENMKYKKNNENLIEQNNFLIEEIHLLEEKLDFLQKDIIQANESSKSSEVHVEELNQLRNEIIELSAINGDLHKEMESIQNKYTEINKRVTSENEDLKKELSEIRWLSDENLLRLTIEIEKLSTTNNDLQKEIENKQTIYAEEFARVSNENEELKKQDLQVNLSEIHFEEVKELRSKVEEISTINDELQKETEAIQRKFCIEIEKLYNENEELKQELIQANKSPKISEVQLEEVKQIRNDLEEMLKMNNDLQTELQNTKDKYAKDNGTLSDENSKLKDEVSVNIEKNKQIIDENKELLTEIEIARKKYAEENDKLFIQNEELLKEVSKCSEHIEIISNENRRMFKAKNELEMTCKLLENIKDKEEKLSEKYAELLHENMDLKEQIDYLKRNSNDISHDLLYRKRMFEENLRLSEKYREDSKKIFDENQKDVEKKYAKLLEESENTKLQLQDNQQLLKEIEQKCDRISEKSSSLESENVKLLDENTSQKSEIESLQNERHYLTFQNKVLKAEMELLFEKIQSLEKEMLERQRIMDEKIAELEEGSADNIQKILQEEILDKNKKISEFEKKINIYKGDIERFRERCDLLQNVLTDNENVFKIEKEKLMEENKSLKQQTYTNTGINYDVHEFDGTKTIHEKLLEGQIVLQSEITKLNDYIRTEKLQSAKYDRISFAEILDQSNDTTIDGNLINWEGPSGEENLENSKTKVFTLKQTANDIAVETTDGKGNSFINNVYGRTQELKIMNEKMEGKIVELEVLIEELNDKEDVFL